MSDMLTYSLLLLLLLFVLTDDCVAKVAGEEEPLGGEATQPKFRKYHVRRCLDNWKPPRMPVDSDEDSDCSDSPTETITTEWLSG